MEKGNMNKYQEALSYILHDLEFNDFIRYKNGNDVDKYHRQVLIDLVKKATPMKVVNWLNNKEMACCPVCNQAHDSEELIKYCLLCGQRLDWSEDEVAI